MSACAYDASPFFETALAPPEKEGLRALYTEFWVWIHSLNVHAFEWVWDPRSATEQVLVWCTVHNMGRFKPRKGSLLEAGSLRLTVLTGAAPDVWLV
mmetsp:Transcript_2198/g.5607  ORF Transcript_2198/g.5607 Transcript_2198/m.5607 type:complete len:97 (+) Transcript_2198:636-926(+)